MTMNKFAVTKENVEEIIDQLYEMYGGRIEKETVRAFFGGWNNDGWMFESEWFEDVESIEQVFDSFAEWADL